MPRQSASTWDGAPPVSEDGFTFVHGELFAEASGQNRHRRATAAELTAHVASGSDKDKPAHWFEAQLVHYGLKPSKTKAVARMRLVDAVNAGNLIVPAHITKLEAKLKKEWTKNDRDLKKGGSSKIAGTSAAKTEPKAPKTNAGVKRKAPETTTAAAAPKQSSAKKAKTTSSATTTAAPKKALTPKAKPVAPKTKVATPKATPNASKPEKKQTARRGGHSQGPARGASATTMRSPERPAWPKQTARRSAAIVARGRIPAPAAQNMGYNHGAGGPDYRDFDPDEPPPPYSEGLGNYGNESENDYGYDDDDDDDEVRLAPLGLLNGAYGISYDMTDEWSFRPTFNINLTLEGSSLWGAFKLSVVEGILHFSERPWQSSHDHVPFEWRGLDYKGDSLFGHSGWMKFLGDGRVEGWFDYVGIAFRGKRFQGQGTRGGNTAADLRHDWIEFSEERFEYDRWAQC